MKKVGRRLIIGAFVFFAIIASMLCWISITAGVTHIEFVNRTGSSVRYQVVEKSSGWSKAGMLQSGQSVKLALTPKRAGILEVKIEGDAIAIEDDLYVERARAITFAGSIEPEKILWKVK